MLDIIFKGQKKDEEVIALFHKSPWSYLKSFILIGLLIIALPLALLIIFGISPIILSLAGISALAALMLITRTYYLWSNNLFLITNIRVIALVQDSIFTRHLKEAYLDSICQVIAKVKGPIKTMFNFGDVLVQTEAEMWLEDIEIPYEAKNSIFAAIEERKKDTGSYKT